MPTDHRIPPRRLTEKMNQKKITYDPLDFTIPADHIGKMKMKENENMSKYQ